MTPGALEIEELTPAQFDEVEPLLLKLQLTEQRYYAHPQLTPEELGTQLLGPVRPTFTGENLILGARVDEGRLVGFCWVVLFDPGTGLEGELAELYVEPSQRGRGVGKALVRHAQALLAERGVTFASVWSRHDNAAANAAYAAAGFAPTEQLVLTWLPTDEEPAPG